MLGAVKTRECLSQSGVLGEMIGVLNKVNFQLVFSSCISLELNFLNAFYLSQIHCVLIKDVGETALLSFDKETEKFGYPKSYDVLVLESKL